MKYKNKDGISLNYTGNDAHQKLVREVVSKAIDICSNYNWYSETSMRFALENTKNFLKENFDISEVEDYMEKING
jgi:hypothetical protein